MKRFSTKQFLPRNPVQRDFVVCLILWAILELVSFAIVSAIPVSAVELQPQQLFALSIPLGLGGACAMAGSTRISIARATFAPDRSQQRLIGLAAQALSWIGLVGIGFPLLILIFQIALWALSPFRA